MALELDHFRLQAQMAFEAELALAFLARERYQTQGTRGSFHYFKEKLDSLNREVAKQAVSLGIEHEVFEIFKGTYLNSLLPILKSI